MSRKKLGIELDGSQHVEAVQNQYDQERTRFLNLVGISILGFWDNEVLQQIDSVLESIFVTLTATHPNPLLEREGK